MSDCGLTDLLPVLQMDGLPGGDVSTSVRWSDSSRREKDGTTNGAFVFVVFPSVSSGFAVFAAKFLGKHTHDGHMMKHT